MTAWWGQSDIPEGEQRRWRIGSSSVWVERLPHEWRVAWESADGDGLVEAAARCEHAALLEREHVARFGVQDVATTLRVLPALADRPVVTRPEKPFAVPPQHTITVFVGSPLWFQISAPPGAPPLFDQPIVRPSDTWFGPTTQTGELCYATRTSCRLRLEELRIRPHRAITAVTIKNRSQSRLELERMKLPVVHLGLHAAASGALWTEAVKLVNLDDEDLAPLRVESGPPAVAGPTERIASARTPADENLLVRAFSSIFAS